jgi:hypothetical protein
MVRDKLILILIRTCIIPVILTNFVGCASKQQITKVVVGSSITNVKLGMSIDQVIKILGEPCSQFSGKDIEKFGRVYNVTPEGKYQRTSGEELTKIKLIRYLKPPLDILINENNKVEKLSLGYCENVFVQDYPFLKFNYLTQEELNRIGEPTSKYRMQEAEKVMMANAPTTAIYEYYEYFYESLGVNLGLVFDRTKQKNSTYFIGVNHIDVYSILK